LSNDRIENVIAIFDSGVGGLTVLRAISELLPDERLVYLGDSARIPYGTKSYDTVKRFALESAKFLMRFKPRITVIACNTASAVAVDYVAQHVPVPVYGVVRPGAKAACSISQTGRIGVMATETTIRSGAYTREIHSFNPDAKVFPVPCPLLVPFIEDGRCKTDPATRMIVEEYVGKLRNENVDTILLGCTHYPLLGDLIGEVAGESVSIVDSASETAKAIAADINDGETKQNGPGGSYFMTTDNAQRFAAVGGRFLGKAIKKVFLVEPEEFFAGPNADSHAPKGLEPGL